MTDNFNMLLCDPIKLKTMYTAGLPHIDIEELLDKATTRIEQHLNKGIRYEQYPDMAELLFERAQLYMLHKSYDKAIQDYSECLDYDPYFYEADKGREAALSMKRTKIALAQ